jgi:hypothetical protein
MGSAGQKPMTRENVLAAYRPLRTAIQSVLKAATSSCIDSDWRRAAKLLGLDLHEDGELLEAAQHTEMLMDVAIFEPNHLGNRVFDRFLKGAGRKLSPENQKVAQALGSAFFSIFQVTGRHEQAGLCLEDLLNGARIWIVDEGLEASASDGMCFAARIFDAGDFHAGLGIMLPLSDEDVEEYLALKDDGFRKVVNGRFAPMAYRDFILGNMLEMLNNAMADMSPDDLNRLGELMLELDVDLPSLPALPAPRSAGTRKRA